MEAIVLDANVLHSNLLRGFFLWLSKSSKLFQLVWSSQIWDEVFRNHPGDESEKRQFRSAIEEVVLSQFSDSMKTLKDSYEKVGLPDPDDEHIVALARQERAATVITFNLKDFPSNRIEPVGVRAIHPDDFLCDLYQAKKAIVDSALLKHLQNLTRTKPTKATFIDGFRRADVSKFSERLAKEDASGNLFPEIWA